MAYSLFTARRVLSAHNMPVSGNPVCCSYFYMRQQHCRHLYSPQLPPTQSFHASTLRSRGYIHKPRHPLPSITLGELRKAYKQRKRNEPVANKELMALLNSLGDNNEDHHAPAVKRAAAEVESALENRDHRSKKSYTLYQLARYVRRH